MNPISSLIMSRLNTTVDAYNFDAIQQNTLELVKNMVDEKNNKKNLAEIISSLLTAVIYLQTKIDGVTDNNLINFAKANSLEFPKLEVSEPPLSATLSASDLLVPAGLGRLEKSKSRGQIFRWLLGDIPLVHTFRVKHTRSIRVKIHYLSFADGVSCENLSAKFDDADIKLTDDKENKVLVGVMTSRAEFRSDLVTLRLVANKSIESASANGPSRNISLSITSIVAEAITEGEESTK